MRVILTAKNEEIIVDDDDFEWLNTYSWYLTSEGYAYTTIGHRTEGNLCHIAMHRMILGLPHGDPRIGDHKNGNIADNRRENLRICTTKENSRNRKVNLNSKIGLKGVRLHVSGKYQARICYSGKRRSLGLFDTPELAKEFYDLAASLVHGDFARAE